jgi:hypothetical protein
MAELQIPDWVPPTVKKVAAICLLDADPIGRRLLTDPRMEVAWNTLMRSSVAPDALDHCEEHRRLNQYYEVASLSEKACAALFVHTVQEFMFPRAVWTQAKAGEFKEKWGTAEEVCRIIVSEAPMFGAEFAAAAQAMISGFDRWAPELKKGGILSGRHNPAYFQPKPSADDPLTRGRACAIARKTGALFGNYSYRTTATITNVGLDLSPEIDWEKVRSWCESMDSASGAGKLAS